MNYSLSTDNLKVIINSFGAEICSVRNTNDLEFIWQAKKDVWARHAPVLFPIVGQLKDNHYFIKDNSYQLHKHGFARDSEFELLSNNPSSLRFGLSQNDETKVSYPYDFNFEIAYELNGSTLTTLYKVINPSNESMYFSVGGHPGFVCPLTSSETFEDYYFEFESSNLRVTELNNGLRKNTKKDLHLAKNKLFLSETLFDNDALVFENNQVNKISLRSLKSAHNITLECHNWPYFGIWSKERCKEYVCMEPWYGVADSESSNQDFIQKDGIIKLDPQKEFNCSFAVTFA
jgi:galactose mutarotase-like enzyme